MLRTVGLALIALLLAPEAKGYSTEGCKGRKDPYRGKPPAPKGMVRSGDIKNKLVTLDASIKGIKVDLKYKTSANFTQKPLYPASAKCWLLPALATKLKQATKRLARGGFGLVVYDCYRPWSVQVSLWQACPKRGLVGDPAKGSHHNRGAAVDLGIYRLSDGKILAMPSAFDDLSHRARHNYQGSTPAAREHRRWLRLTMQRVGLRPIASEWWHYQLPGAGRFQTLDLRLGGSEGRTP